LVRIRAAFIEVSDVVESVSKEPQQQANPGQSPDVVAAATPDDEALTGQLHRTSELVAAQRLPEAEALLVAARRSFPGDLRVLKLLALVRFKLGRLGDAREVYREAAAAASDDAAIRLNLGLIALKLESFPEAAEELEATVRLQPDDRRAWSYLGYAYAKSGSPMQAATAFRRAGQHELAAEMERAATPSSHGSDGAVVEGLPVAGAGAGSTDSSSGMATPRPLPRTDEDTPIPSLNVELRPREGTQVSTLASFTTARLLSFAPSDARLESLSGGVLRFTAGPETHVRQSALLVALGDEALAVARRRTRGQLSDEVLAADGDRLFRVEGSAELLLASPDPNRRLVGLSLDRDVLYLEASRVMAWGDEIVWEAGSVPGNGSPLLQFRGTGRVVILAGDGELVAVRIAEGDHMTVANDRLAGWLGRVVVQARPAHGAEAAACDHVTCEGEGVLLISKHGESR
jgi:tetratricopeptide (TPR) repeat protein